jgi:outer membrane protein assembly factor BamA
VEDAGRKNFTFNVEEKLPSSASIFGNNKIETDELIGNSDTAFAIVDSEKLKESVDNLKAFYAEKGITTRISYTLEDIIPNAWPSVHISEHGRVYIRRIDSSERGLLDGKLEGRMSRAPRVGFSWLTNSEFEKRDECGGTSTRSRPFYQYNGYMNGRVGEPESGSKRTDRVSIPVEEGGVQGRRCVADRDMIMLEETCLRRPAENRNVLQPEPNPLTSEPDFGICRPGYRLAIVPPMIDVNEDSHTVKINYEIIRKQWSIREISVVAYGPGQCHPFVSWTWWRASCFGRGPPQSHTNLQLLAI